MMPCSKAPVLGLLLDHSKGFGGKYGVEKEKVDQSALGYDYKGETEKHQSQKGGIKGHTVAFSVFISKFKFCQVLPTHLILNPHCDYVTCDPARLRKGLWREVWRRQGQCGQSSGGL